VVPRAHGDEPGLAHLTGHDHGIQRLDDERGFGS